jgi:hypothetical protein
MRLYQIKNAFAQQKKNQQNEQIVYGMEKTFARYSCDRKFTFRIYKELKKK